MNANGTITEPNFMLINSNLAFYIEELKLVKSQIKFLEKEQADIMCVIKEEMKDKEIIIGATGEEIATYKKSFRESFDSKSFKESKPEIYNSFLRSIEVRTFLIK